MALKFSAWPDGAVEKYQQLTIDLMRHASDPTPQVTATLTQLAAATDLSQFHAEDVTRFITQVTQSVTGDVTEPHPEASAYPNSALQPTRGTYSNLYTAIVGRIHGDLLALRDRMSEGR